MIWILAVASSKARWDSRKWSSTTNLPSVLWFRMVANEAEAEKLENEASFRSASHFSIFCLLRSALSQSVRHPPSLFFSARILRPASEVAAPLTCTCSEIFVRDTTSVDVCVRRWESWGIVWAGVRGSNIWGGGRMEKVSLEGVGWSESEYNWSSSSYGF